jgi:hypothetical protein
MAFEMKKQFVGPDGKTFTVEEVLQVDEKLWVHYTSIETGNKYSCLLEAFSERFTLIEDQA